MNVSAQYRILIAFVAGGLLSTACSETGVVTIPQQTVQEPAFSVGEDSRVDPVRGAWVGTLTGFFEQQLDLALYFGARTADPDNPNDPALAVAAGYITLTEPTAQHEPPRLPMSARLRHLGDGEYELVALGNVVAPGDTTIVMKLSGTLATNGPGLADDRVVEGAWWTMQSHGRWDATHRDRRRVDASLVDLDDPTTRFWVNSDAHTHQRITLTGEWEVHTLVSISTNVVSAYGRVVLPTGDVRLLPPTRNLWTPDHVTEFHFFDAYLMDPLMGPYAFSVLDVAGDPIPGVTDTDEYLGGLCPDAPVGLAGSFTEGEGVTFTWTAVAPIDYAFLDDGRGFYQLEIFKNFDDHGDMFGARFLQTAEVLIPWSGPLDDGMYGVPLIDFGPGEYRVTVLALSEAPHESAGKNAECARVDSRADVYFTKMSAGGIEF